MKYLDTFLIAIPFAVAIAIISFAAYLWLGTGI